MKKFYKNLNRINRMIEKRHPEFLYYKDDIYEIINLYLENDNNIYNTDSEYSYISEEDSINLVRMFLSIFDCGYVEKFDKADKLLLTKEEIESLLQSNNISDITRRQLHVTLTNDGVVHLNVKTGECLISTLRESGIKDSFLLLHEFTHFLSQSSGNLTEVQPILSEFILSYYLKNSGYSEIELDRYWRKRIRLLEPCGYFVDLGFTLKLIDIVKENGVITKEMLKMNDCQFDSFVKRYENNSNIFSFVKNLDSIDFRHVMGFYKALRIYETVPRDRIYSVFTELNGVSLWLGEEEFNNYIDMIIKEEKGKVRIKDSE